MRILSIGNFNTGWDGSICDEEHIASALEDLGHEVTRVQREDQINSLAQKWGDYDFTLIAQWDGFQGYFVDSLPRPLVYWAFDYQEDGQEWHEKLVRKADLYLSKRIADSRFDNWQWLAQDFAPQFLDKFEGEVEKDIDVLFTGSYLPWAEERTATLQAIDEQFDLHIYSFTPSAWIDLGFKHVHGPVMDQQLPELVARAKVVVGIDHTIEAGYWSDRNAQTMCAGGLMLSKYVPLMEARFHNYVDYFSTPEECIERIKFYLENDTYRGIEAERGYQFAQDFLKVDRRVADLLEIVERKLAWEKE